MSPASLRVLIAPDSFKGSLPAPAVASAIARGWHRERPHDELLEVPMADGGEGTLLALSRSLPEVQRAWVSDLPDPFGHPATRPVPWLRTPDGTAVVELAITCGIEHVHERDPLGATTLALGHLLQHILTQPEPVRRLLIGLGSSASTEGGFGALVGLGARGFATNGHPVAPNAYGLQQLASLDLTQLTPPPPGGVELLTDVQHPLLGPDGAAATFGPQKGATDTEVVTLEHGLRQLVASARAAGLIHDPNTAGYGAAGGTGYGLGALWGGKIVSGAHRIAALAGIPELLPQVNVLITGEGRFDATSLHGKVVGTLWQLWRQESNHPESDFAIIAGSGTPEGLQWLQTQGHRAAFVETYAPHLRASMSEPIGYLENAAAALAAQRNI